MGSNLATMLAEFYALCSYKPAPPMSFVKEQAHKIQYIIEIKRFQAQDSGIFLLFTVPVINSSVIQGNDTYHHVFIRFGSEDIATAAKVNIKTARTIVSSLSEGSLRMS